MTRITGEHFIHDLPLRSSATMKQIARDALISGKVMVSRCGGGFGPITGSTRRACSSKAEEPGNSEAV
jgi:hypothetical protein